MGNSSIGHMCEQMRGDAHRLNPLARVISIQANVNFLPRQRCVRLRTSRSDPAPSSLTVSYRSRPNTYAPTATIGCTSYGPPAPKEVPVNRIPRDLNSRYDKRYNESTAR